MPELCIHVPTYYGELKELDKCYASKNEFDGPFKPVIVRQADGVRVVLGSHDFWDADAPDLQIERRSRGWVIFLHPKGAGDPAGSVYFLDDGRSFLVPEQPGSATPPTVPLSHDAAVAEVDKAQII